MSKSKILKIVLWILICVMVAVIVGFFLYVVLHGIKTSFNAEKAPANTVEPGTTEEIPTETPKPTEAATPTETETATPDVTPTETATPTPEPVTFKDVDVVAVGDVIIYTSMWQSAKAYGKGEYDFSELTQYVKDIAEGADLAVFNFEDTCAGEEVGYSAYPSFNAPDNILTTMRNSGFKVSLYANNHTYDKGHNGFMRTQQVMKDNGLTTYGTRTSENEKSYGIYEVEGIKIGFLNYTYESGSSQGDATKKYLNGIPVDANDIPLIDSFHSSRLDSFYQEVSGRIADLREGGADVIMFFIHWGEEYKENANTEQRDIAQNLCNLGVNALIGMHPHVVQPVDTYVSYDGRNRMICYYSLGNFASAQNRTTFQENYDYAWLTENELMAKLTVRKYSTGEALIVNADYEPLWSHRFSSNSRIITNIIPLRKALASDEAKEQYGLTNTSFGVTHATAAKEYIDSQVASGIASYNAGIVLPR